MGYNVGRMPLPLAISIAGLERAEGAPWESGPRAAIEWAAGAGFQGVALDGAAPGLRARELDRSARRDLAALLRRLQLRFGGIDLWIPAEHYTDPARAERALEATLAAVDLCAELGRLSEVAGMPAVSLPMSAEGAESPRRAVEAHAETRGVVVALYTFGSAAEFVAGSPVGAGVDPAAVLLAGGDPAKRVSELGASLKVARLSDATGIGRAPIGASGTRLDRLAYSAALAVGGYPREVVLDLRGLRDQAAAAARARELWEALPI
jgi:sugar phosphate isomerase/epimerase